MKKSTIILLAVVVIIALSVGACAPGSRAGYGYGRSGWGAGPMMSNQGFPGGYCGGYFYPGQNRGALWNTPAHPGTDTQ